MTFQGTTVLDTPMEPSRNGAAASTVREYLKELLLTLWREAEGFSGKRPFGDSGWEWDLAIPLVRAGLMPGKFDEDGYLDDCDNDALNDLIQSAIETMGE